MYTKEELEAKTVDELRKIAPKVGVKGCRKLKKPELIAAIVDEQPIDVESEEVNVESAESVSEKSEVKTEVKVEDVVEATPVTSNREAYVDTAKVDMIVAFKLPNGKVKSAKIVKRSTAKRRFMVETKYGAQFIISFDDVVWVKTGTRWPKHVYNLMKGIGNNNG